MVSENAHTITDLPAKRTSNITVLKKFSAFYLQNGGRIASLSAGAYGNRDPTHLCGGRVAGRLTFYAAASAVFICEIFD